VHPLVLAVVMPWSNRPAACAVLVIASLVVANATYHWIEVPFQKIGRSLAARDRTPPLRAG